MIFDSEANDDHKNNRTVKMTIANNNQDTIMIHNLQTLMLIG